MRLCELLRKGIGAVQACRQRAESTGLPLLQVALGAQGLKVLGFGGTSTVGRYLVVALRPGLILGLIDRGAAHPALPLVSLVDHDPLLGRDLITDVLRTDGTLRTSDVPIIIGPFLPAISFDIPSIFGYDFT